MQSIQTLKPDIVIIAGYWVKLYKAEQWPDTQTKIEPTIAALKQAGVKRIVLIGPPPMWPKKLPDFLIDYWRTHNRQPLPLRYNLMWDDPVPPIEKFMRDVAKRQHIPYVSLDHMFCNADGCLAGLTQHAEDMLTWDPDAHITPNVSRFIVQKNADVLLGKP